MSAFAGKADMAYVTACCFWSKADIARLARCAERTGHICRCYCALAPENCTTLAHVAVSATIVRPESSGEPGSATPPRLDMRSLIFASAIARFTSSLSKVMISAGVPFGAQRPLQALAR